MFGSCFLVGLVVLGESLDWVGFSSLDGGQCSLGELQKEAFAWKNLLE